MIIDGINYEVVIEKKRIKNIYFRVKEDMKIYVTCPYLISNKEINNLLNKNINSLRRMIKQQTNRSKSLDKVMYLGKEIDYIYYKKCMIDGNKIYAPSIEDANEYLEKNSLKHFEERMSLYINEFDNLPKFRLRIRKMKSRWGVCNKGSMTVTLNTLLIHKSDFLIDYVIVHELSHFKHMNHGPKFWECVSLHYPEYKKAIKGLKE